MNTTYQQVDLFGGAITAALPSTFADVSDIRQIPDNQEVYLEANGFTSIVVEILERVDQPDEKALQYHFKDITEEDGDDTEGAKIWTTGIACFSKLPQATPAYTLLATAPPGRKHRGSANEPDFEGILLCLVRLEQKNTDILISVNVPHIQGQYEKAEVDPESGKHGSLLERGLEYRQKILETFEVRDWSLFV